MRIENHFGFHKGVTGAELAEGGTVRAIKFGACLPVAMQVNSLTFDNNLSVLHLDDGQTVTAKCLLIATGADYRMLGIDRCEIFEGCGVYYAATPLEAQMCLGSEVVVVGGGNSAGQAAVFLSHHVRRVYLVVRGDDLGKNMSDYLVKRIEACPNIEVLLNTVVKKLNGEKSLSGVEVVNNETGEVRTLHVPALFSFIGAVPRTDWLPDEIEKDAKDFVRTDGPHWRSQLTGRCKGSRICWKPAGPAFSRQEMRARVRSSGLHRLWAKGRWRSSSCTIS
jgi:thioredoxin reductase (NADPH)